MVEKKRPVNYTTPLEINETGIEDYALIKIK